MSVPTPEDIRDAAASETFGRPLVSNIYRGLIAEIIVGKALGRDWDMCSQRLAGLGFRTPRRLPFGG